MNTDPEITAAYDTARRFAEKEIAPHINQWEEAATFPRALYTKAADAGLLGLGYPEALGGTPAPFAMRNAISIALARYGTSGGVLASLFSCNIGLPPVLRYGSAALQQQVIPPVLRGEQIAALAITEPGGGSDVAALRTTARLEGDEWVIDGEKVFITSGMRADWLTVAVRTGPSKGASGISMIVVPGNAKGIQKTELKKMGWWCSDTAQLHFSGVRVPAGNLLGEPGSGFKIIMTNFNGERLAMSALALGFAQACYDEAVAWARQRQTFGTALVERQVIRHKLVDMQMRINATEAWVNAVTARLDRNWGRENGGQQNGGQSPISFEGCHRRADGRPELESDPNFAAPHSADPNFDPGWVAQVCQLKNQATQTMQFCADQAVQILGGMGYMRGSASERIYREVKVMMIGGGSEEIMKELAARQLGL